MPRASLAGNGTGNGNGNGLDRLADLGSSAALLVATVETIGARAPAVMAAAAHELAAVHLALHFGDGSHASLHREHSRLVATPTEPETPSVAVHFDDRSLKLLFDADRKPVDALFAGSLDVRGTREEVLATWRCFALLAQRASGLRAVQALWAAYREQHAARWREPVRTEAPARRRGVAQRAPSQWPALDYLDRRYPADVELRRADHPPFFARARSLWDGRRGHAWGDQPPVFDNDLQQTMQRFKARVTEEILSLLPKRRAPREELYEPMRDYVTREGKGLRPTLVIATCMALGGALEHGVRAAAALEMFHNGFLVHDDIADGSTHRRGRPTLHQKYGVGIAVNAGDGMNLFAVDLVLSNLPTRGLAGTLALIHEVLHMCRETVEGQAVELGWIRRNVVPPRDADYFRMSTQKTGWYTCITPARMGAVCAGVTDPEVLARFNETFRLIGIAFQIQDDVLNLVGETERYGKEALGDLLEGKRTVMMIHLFRSANERVKRRMRAINALPREAKTQTHAEEMLAAMKKAGSIDYAIALADRLAHRGVRHFERDLAFIGNNEAKAVLRQIAHYVTTRAL